MALHTEITGDLPIPKRVTGETQHGHRTLLSERPGFMPFDASTFLDVAKIITMVLIGASFFASMVRVVLGPSTADRVVAMDMISMLVIGFISVYCIEIESEVYLNATIILALVSFLSVIAIARYVERPQQESLDEMKKEDEEESEEEKEIEQESDPEEEHTNE